MPELERPEEGPDYSGYLEGTEWELPIDLDMARVIDQGADVFSKYLTDQGWDEDTVMNSMLVFREAMANAFKYGKPESENNDPKIHVSFHATPDSIQLTIQDPGKGFDWRSVPDPRTKEGLERTQGRGLFMMRSMYDTVEYTEPGNKVTLRLGPEGILGDSEVDWEEKIPSRLDPKKVDILKAQDGLYHWRLKPEYVRDPQLRKAYEEERKEWP